MWIIYCSFEQVWCRTLWTFSHAPRSWFCNELFNSCSIIFPLFFLICRSIWYAVSFMLLSFPQSILTTFMSSSSIPKSLATSVKRLSTARYLEILFRCLSASSKILEAKKAKKNAYQIFLQVRSYTSKILLLKEKHNTVPTSVVGSTP